jgi:hypothetical protein
MRKPKTRRKEDEIRRLRRFTQIIKDKEVEKIRKTNSGMLECWNSGIKGKKHLNKSCQSC